MGTQIILSSLKPDYEDLRAQLQTALASRGSWAGYLPTQTGQTLIDFVATVGALGQTKGLRYAQDSFSETAVSARAQYAIANTQGLRLTRKLAATLPTSVLYTAPTGSPNVVSIPAFTQFQAAGTYWYTIDTLSLQSGVSQSVSLYQGYIVDQTVQGLGTDYQSFVSVEKNFTVSDTHVFVYNGTTPITRALDGLWLYKGTPAYLDRTTSDGRLRILFGNDSYGYSPAATDSVRIVYAVTSGYDGNSITALNSNLVQTNNIVSGVVYTITDNPDGGGNEPDANTYKTIASTNFGSFGSAVTKNQYLSTVLAYPGVIDARTFAQREIDPTDVTLMNTVKVVPLTSSVWDTNAQNTFLSALQASTMYAVRFYIQNPVAVTTNITLNIYCYNWATLSDCQASAAAAVTALFQNTTTGVPRVGILGYDIALSDITGAVLNSNAGIEYLDIVSPTSDLIVSGASLPKPTLTATTGGTLSPGTYSYAIYVQDNLGKTVPSNYASIVLTSGQTAVTVSWTASANAVNYYIVGRQGTFGTLASVSASTLTYTDTGSATPTLPLPTLAGYPVAYSALGTLSITPAYSTRIPKV